mmetsp:Transcript_11020/g.35002  ORF Transcript_11020/g.35002 Transcript_11020/m.35002 type:complete len:455 (-) Transcript_11020:23-1387(-)
MRTLCSIVLSTAAPGGGQRIASASGPSSIRSMMTMPRAGVSSVPHGASAAASAARGMYMHSPAALAAFGAFGARAGPQGAIRHQRRMMTCSAAANTAKSSEGEGEKKPARKQRVLSGVQPTGNIHLGNYLGAMKNWVGLQDEYDTFFCVVDLHAITMPHDPKELREASRRNAALYLACGIDPAKSKVFLQSHVTAHAELTWLLNCNTPMGWLERMIQYKEKARKQGEEVGFGLLGYPVLMAADILLYQADLVPVGDDQKQHLELTRDIAGRMNNLYGGRAWKKMGGRGGKLFKVPEVMIPPAGARVMSLQDGTAKMSKSAESELSRVNLLDSPDTLRNKVKRCKTDSAVGLEIGNPERPEATNLLTMYQLVTGKTQDEVLAECGGMNWGTFKPLLADALIAHLEPIQTRYAEVMEDEGYLDGVLLDGARHAHQQAQWTLGNVREAMGFVPPPKF